MDFSKIKAWFVYNWSNFPLQLIGTWLMLPGLVFSLTAVYVSGVYSVLSLWNVKNYALLFYCYGAWVIYSVVGILDLYIVAKAKKKGASSVTITRWYRALLPKKFDNVFMIVLIVLTWAFVGPLLGLYYLRGFLNSHLNEDRNPDLTKHASDCTVYNKSSLEPSSGICTCGYGLQRLRKGDKSQLYSV